MYHHIRINISRIPHNGIIRPFLDGEGKGWYFILCVLMLSMVIGGVGCKRNLTNDAEITDIDPATLLSDSIEADNKEPIEPRLVFNSPREMLRYMDESPDSAHYARGILRRMVETAPQYVDSLLNSHKGKFIVADKAKMRVCVFDSFGVMLSSFRMAAAKNYGNKHHKGDSRTPEGYFRVEGVYDSTEWLFTDDNGVTSDVKGQYGPRFIRIATTPRRWPIGIHGTNAPWSVGGRRSHGCMRLNNEDIMALVAQVEKGMPVIISPSQRDEQVNKEEGTPTPRIWTGDNFAESANGRPETVTTEKKDTVIAPIEEEVPVETPQSTLQEEAEPTPTPMSESSE